MSFLNEVPIDSRAPQKVGAALKAPSFAERMICNWMQGIYIGQITVTFPSGFTRTFGAPQGKPQANVHIRDMRLFWRLLFSGGLGFAESYMAGEVDTPDLSVLMSTIMLNADALNQLLSQNLAVKLYQRLRHYLRANTPKGSQRNIAAHYDLGNDFYRHWLDESMTYSSALFDSKEDSLALAQRRKYRRLAENLRLEPGDKVLEIGCGWGGFAQVAAEDFGCDIVGLTLSKEQATYARRRMAAAGLAAKVDIRLQDYRDVTGKFDKIASIEMFEAVGEENWPIYFAKLDACLKPGGRAAIQSITIDDQIFPSYRRNADFIQRYIFPGGMLPSPSAFTKAVEDAGLRLQEAFYFGKSYAQTLRHWHEAFKTHWRTIETQGFDQRFERMWRYYLNYCETGFEQGRLNVGQFIIER